MSNIVKVLRAKYNMTQEELAKQSKTTRQTIIRIEKGKKPSFDVAMNISKVFGIPVNSIFFNSNAEQALQRELLN